jgi:hypothetical protein
MSAAPPERLYPREALSGPQAWERGTEGARKGGCEAWRLPMSSGLGGWRDTALAAGQQGAACRANAPTGQRAFRQRVPSRGLSFPPAWRPFGPLVFILGASLPPLCRGSIIGN